MNKSRNQKFISAFGENLRKIRIEKGYTQEDLSHKSDLQLTQIGRIERGEMAPPQQYRNRYPGWPISEP